LADKDGISPTEVKGLLNGSKVLAITFGTDGRTQELGDSVGAANLLDKMDLADELVPAILELAPERTTLYG
jgi:hypothetical protein